MDEVEKFEGDVVMQVPVRANRISAWILQGDGVPSKVVVGGRDIEPEFLLHLANDRCDAGPYIHAERIRAGMLALAGRPHQGSDQTHMRGGLSVGMGTSEHREGEGDRVEADDPLRDGEEASAWLVRQPGRSLLLVCPSGPDSFEVAEALAPDMHGRFGLKPVLAGQMTLAADPIPPGWRLVVEPQPATEPGGLGVRH